MAGPDNWFRSPLLLAEAKGVAGLGKAGGDGQGGSDKAGQQVPPEVYMALTYAGTLFLFTLSVPLILYGLNKLLNKIEDCFGCGSSRRERKAKQLKQQQQQKESSVPDAIISNHQQQKLVNEHNNTASIDQSLFHPDNTTSQLQHNQRFNLQLLQQHPKYTQFISMSSKPEYNMTNDNTSNDKDMDQHPPLIDVSRHQQQHPPQTNQEISLTPTAAA